MQGWGVNVSGITLLSPLKETSLKRRTVIRKNSTILSGDENTLIRSKIGQLKSEKESVFRMSPMLIF